MKLPSFPKDPILRKYIFEAGAGAVTGGTIGTAEAVRHKEKPEGVVMSAVTGVVAGATLPALAGQVIRNIRLGKAMKNFEKADVQYSAMADELKNIQNRRVLAKKSLDDFGFRSAMEEAHRRNVQNTNYSHLDLKGMESELKNEQDNLARLYAQKKQGLVDHHDINDKKDDVNELRARLESARQSAKNLQGSIQGDLEKLDLTEEELQILVV